MIAVVLPSSTMFAPRRLISGTCMKRFSKIVSVTRLVPSAIAFIARNCACMSVGNAGYGAVRMSTARGRAPFMSSSSQSFPWLSVAPASSSLINTDSSVSGRVSFKPHASAGRRRRDQIGSGLDTIGHHAMMAAVQLVDAFDHDRRGALPFDSCAHRDQAFREIDDLGFTRGVFEDRRAARERRRHHQILGAADGRDVHQDVRSATNDRSHSR